MKKITMFVLIALLLAASVSAGDAIIKNGLFILDELDVEKINSDGGSVDIGGNLGVGTTGKEQRLSVGTTTTITPALAVFYNDNLSFGLKVNNEGWQMVSGANTGLVQKGDKIGIGTENPVQGKLNVDGSNGIALFSTSSNEWAGVFAGAGKGLYAIKISVGNPNWIAPQGGMVVNGKVGIGKSNPDVELDVVGDIKATRSICAGDICLSPSAWSSDRDGLYYNTSNLGVGAKANQYAKLYVKTNDNDQFSVMMEGGKGLNLKGSLVMEGGELSLSNYPKALIQFKSGEGDIAKIYSENYGNSPNSNQNRLVIETADDGNSDYIVFRNMHYNEGAKDVMEVKRDIVIINGTLKVSGDITATAPTPTQDKGIANKEYVDSYVDSKIAYFGEVCNPVYGACTLDCTANYGMCGNQRGTQACNYMGRKLRIGATEYCVAVDSSQGACASIGCNYYCGECGGG